jgi:hypothetical protein
MKRLYAYISMLRPCLTDAFHLSQHGSRLVRYSLTSDLNIDVASSLMSNRFSSGTPATLGLRNVRCMFSALAVTLAGILASVSAHVDERFRQRLDPLVSWSSSGIEMEGIGGRLIRDGHAELDDDHR